MEFILQNYNRVFSGEIEVNELIVKKVLHKSLKEYSKLYLHVAARKQLGVLGGSNDGQLVKYLYINHKSFNPLTSLQGLPLCDGRSYDREKYGALVFESGGNPTKHL